jgi:hypothetical protein
MACLINEQARSVRMTIIKNFPLFLTYVSGKEIMQIVNDPKRNKVTYAFVKRYIYETVRCTDRMRRIERELHALKRAVGLEE